MTRSNTPQVPTQRTTWTVAEAKSHFSELIQQAETSAPQTITRHGKPTVVVVSASEWERKNKTQGLLRRVSLEFASSRFRTSDRARQR